MTKFIKIEWLPFFGAFTVCQSIVLIRPSQDTNALRTHELTHVAQMAKHGTIMFSLKYLFSRSFRQEAEVEAYKAQILAGTPVDFCARMLATKYWLGIDIVKARGLLGYSLIDPITTISN